MACEIKIENAFGNDAGASYWIYGTVTDCSADVEGAQVIVGLSCRSEEGPFTERTADVDESGNWNVVIPNPGDCSCDQRVFLTARCATDPECQDARVIDEVQCVDCPTIDFFQGDDVGLPFVEVNCNPDGSASVSMSFVVQNTTPDLIFINVHCGPGGTKESGGFVGFTPGSSGTVTSVCRYPTPFAPSPSIHFLNADYEPYGCPPEPIPVPVLPPCEEQDCPSIENIIVTIGQCTRDPDDGIMKRRVHFEPQLSGPAPTSHNWTFGDGESALAGGPPDVIEHLYAGKPTMPVRLSINGPPPCETSDLEVPESAFDSLEACECPVIASIDVTIGDCEVDPDDGVLKRIVTFTPNVTGPPPAGHSWDFGDGSSDLGPGTPGPIQNYYETAPTTEPELCIDGPEPCAMVCQTVPLAEFETFESCGDGNGNGNGDGDCPWYDPRCWSWCGVLGALLALLIAGYLVAIATGFTADISQTLSMLPGFPDDLSEGVVIGAIGGILGSLMALYGSLCGLCNLGRVMLAGAILGVLTIIVLALFGVALPNWVGAGITAIVIGLTGYALIARECD